MSKFTEEELREVSQIALETALQMIAEQAFMAVADYRSGNLPMVSADVALEAFGNAILSTNAKLWPVKGVS